jgi:hypothetical protein
MLATVRDRLWLWGHDAGAHNDGWGLPGPSRITPAEAAFYLGIPNLIMVRYHGRPPLPFDRYTVPFRPLKRVVWSVVGAAGQTDAGERAHVLDLAGRRPNIVGLMLDDFFAGSPEQSSEGSAPAALTLNELRQLRGQLTVADRQLELWVVLYEHQLTATLSPYLEMIDTITFWSWDVAGLPNLPSRFTVLEKLAPGAGKVLGCYLWDYAGRRPMAMDLLQRQCAFGLEGLMTGRLDGLIFLASCLCDLELEAVEWVRRWIAEVADQPLKPRDRPRQGIQAIV